VTEDWQDYGVFGGKELDEPAEVEAEIVHRFVKTVKHRLVDLDWTAGTMCKEAGISPSHWSEICNHKKSLSLEIMHRVCSAVGLKIQMRLKVP
jgi:plasmid maintenance system antidote protein VapI